MFDLQFTTKRSIKIKLEVDINPPIGFMTEPKLLLLPYSFMTRCYTLPYLYAGKIHALLFRNWKSRVKGRKALGRDVVITKKIKKNQTNIESAFFQHDLFGELVTFNFILGTFPESIFRIDFSRLTALFIFKKI